MRTMLDPPPLAGASPGGATAAPGVPPGPPVSARRTHGWVVRRTAVLAAGLGVLTGCNPAEPTSAPAQVRSGGEVRFLTWSTTWNEPMQPMFQQYTANTGTKITLEWETQADHDAKVTAGLASDTAPDMILSVSQIDTKFYDSGAMLNLSPYVQRDKINIRRDYALMGTEFWCDKVYGLPWHAASSAIYYNKSMLREAGVRDPWADGKGEWTWEDMATIARRVTRPPRGDDPGLWGLWWPYTNPTYFGPNIWGGGGDFVDWEKMRWTLDNPQSLEAFQRYAGWMAKDRFAISDPEAAAIMRAFPGRDLFSAGKTAFRWRLIDDVYRYINQVGADFEWDVLPEPRSGGRPGVGVHAAHPHIIPAQSKNADRAFELAKYIAGAEMQEFIGRNKLTLPGLKSKMQTFLEPAPVPHAQVFLDVYKRPYGIHFRHHTTFENWDQFSGVITPMLLGERPLLEGMRELTRQMNDKVKFGGCTPYKGMKHPIQP
jgi:multiple sugar transport system substrate-binding protein